MAEIAGLCHGIGQPGIPSEKWVFSARIQKTSLSGLLQMILVVQAAEYNRFRNAVAGRQLVSVAALRNVVLGAFWNSGS